jgi:hypothetical protein
MSNYNLNPTAAVFAFAFMNNPGLTPSRRRRRIGRQRPHSQFGQSTVRFVAGRAYLEVTANSSISRRLSAGR